MSNDNETWKSRIVSHGEKIIDSIHYASNDPDQKEQVCLDPELQ